MGPRAWLVLATLWLVAAGFLTLRWAFNPAAFFRYPPTMIWFASTAIVVAAIKWGMFRPHLWLASIGALAVLTLLAVPGGAVVLAPGWLLAAMGESKQPKPSPT